jgi:hypothetical protein
MARKSNQSNNQPTTQTIEQSKKDIQGNTSMQPEQIFKRSFAPLTSKKDGTARLTFAGYKHSVTKDGDRPFFSLIFSCMDVTHENPANISVLSSYRYSETNVLGKLLKAMGYTSADQEEEILDEDDEFGYVIKSDLGTIYDFLDSKKGLVFKGEMTQGERNLYRIEVATLQPLMNKEGIHQRDYESDEGLSETEIAIDIEADGGDN